MTLLARRSRVRNRLCVANNFALKIRLYCNIHCNAIYIAALPPIALKKPFLTYLAVS